MALLALKERRFWEESGRSSFDLLSLATFYEQPNKVVLSFPSVFGLG